MGKRKKRTEPSLEERIQGDPTLQLLRERIAHREARLKEERAARGEDTTNEREFLSLSREEQSERVRQKLRARIAYHEAKLKEERAARGEDAASAGK